MGSISRQGITIPDDLEYPVEFFVTPKCYEENLSAVLISEGMILDRTKQLAHEIHNAIGDQELKILCVLKGSYRFFTHLVDELTIVRRNCKTHIQVEFIHIKSYENAHSSKTLQIMGLSNLNDLTKKNILIVEDIIDSGLSLNKLINTLKSFNVSQIWTSFLLSKRIKRDFECQEDFVAFNIPDKFVIGYGLDYNQYFRDLNHICLLNEKGITKYKK